MRYPEPLLVAMRRDLTQHGIEETRTPEAVDQVLDETSGTVLMVINSVCGCAASKARPAVGLALQHAARPDRTATVFAGGDVEAVVRLRERLAGFAPSSPAMALFQNGTPVYMVHRHEIESRTPTAIAQLLTEAFDRYCAGNTAETTALAGAAR